MAPGSNQLWRVWGVNQFTVWQSLMCGLRLEQLKQAHSITHLLAMVQLILPLPDPIQVQSQIMLSLGLS